MSVTPCAYMAECHLIGTGNSSSLSATVAVTFVGTASLRLSQPDSHGEAGSGLAAAGPRAGRPTASLRAASRGPGLLQ